MNNTKLNELVEAGVIKSYTLNTERVAGDEGLMDSETLVLVFVDGQTLTIASSCRYETADTSLMIE